MIIGQPVARLCTVAMEAMIDRQNGTDHRTREWSETSSTNGTDLIEEKKPLGKCVGQCNRVYFEPARISHFWLDERLLAMKLITSRSTYEPLRSPYYRIRWSACVNLGCFTLDIFRVCLSLFIIIINRDTHKSEKSRIASLERQMSLWQWIELTWHLTIWQMIIARSPMHSTCILIHALYMYYVIIMVTGIIITQWNLIRRMALVEKQILIYLHLHISLLTIVSGVRCQLSSVDASVTMVMLFDFSVHNECAQFGLI